MDRVFTTILPLYWGCAFAHEAIDGSMAAIREGGLPNMLLAPAASMSSVQLAMALGNGMAGVLFLWMFLTALVDGDAAPGQTDEVSTLAFAGAAVMAVIGLAATRLGGLPEFGLVGAGSMAALLASYLVVHVERSAAAARRRVVTAELHAAATLMALRAAHSTALSNIAKGPVAANDQGTI